MNVSTHEVLIVGGGPAGSTCAWQLRRAGIDVAILDKAKFPRHKVCAGWITPQVVDELELDTAEYARDHTFQPMTGFCTSIVGDRQVRTEYDRVVSYGILRVEFDDYLLRRSGATVYEGEPLSSLERDNGTWLVNGHIRAKLVIGAGGHFCPVAKYIRARLNHDALVVAQEAEFPMSPAQSAACAISGEVPELFFCADIKGYGWCFRKGDFLNIGLGRRDPHGLADEVDKFVSYLQRIGKIGFQLPSRIRGHAYLLYPGRRTPVSADALLLIGDAAGLAYSQSGEGIRPAIESGLLAASVIANARGQYDSKVLAAYDLLLDERFDPKTDFFTRLGKRLPTSVANAFAPLLMRSRRFASDIVLKQWFLHTDDPALRTALNVGTDASPAHVAK